MTIRLLVIFGIICGTHSLPAQCLSGDCQEGQSQYRFPNGALYEGKMQEGRLHGWGTLYFANGDVYRGQWNKNKREGQGILNTADGLSYQGTFFQNQLHGEGRVYDQNGGYFEGLWHDGNNTTKGTYVNADGQRFRGYWTQKGFRAALPTTEIEVIADCNLVPCGTGKGRMVFPDGSVYTGFFLNGLPDGEGECRYINGVVIRGRWQNGKRVEKSEYIFSNGLVIEFNEKEVRMPWLGEEISMTTIED